MTNLNNNLQIPLNLQEVLRQIDEIPLYLAEIPMDVHPKLPQFDRVLQVKGIDAKSDNEFVYFSYRQVLKDKETGEVVNISLPAPEWVVYGNTWSFLRNERGEAVELPLKQKKEGDTQGEEGVVPDIPTTKETRVRVPSYKYMLWLMKYQNARFLQLIEGYATDFVRVKQNELDAI